MANQWPVAEKLGDWRFGGQIFEIGNWKTENRKKSKVKKMKHERKISASIDARQQQCRGQDDTSHETQIANRRLQACCTARKDGCSALLLLLLLPAKGKEKKKNKRKSKGKEKEKESMLKTQN